MSVKHGPVPLLAAVERDGPMSVGGAEGESVSGPILEIGNTNSRSGFAEGVAALRERVEPSRPPLCRWRGARRRSDQDPRLLGIEVSRVC